MKKTLLQFYSGASEATERKLLELQSKGKNENAKLSTQKSFRREPDSSRVLQRTQAYCVFCARQNP